MKRARAGGLRAPGAAFAVRAQATATPAPVASALQRGERIEATAHCSVGLREAGIAVLTDRRILFAPGKGAVRAFPYSDVRSVHEQAGVATRRRIRVAVAGSRPLHLVAGLGDDLCGIVHRHAPALR